MLMCLVYFEFTKVQVIMLVFNGWFNVGFLYLNRMC